MAKPRHNEAAYKSGLEGAIGEQLRLAGVPHQYEPFRIPFIPTKVRHYTPDFLLPSGIIIETKGQFVSEDRAKHLAVQAQWPHLEIRFVFSNPKARIGKKSKTTYAMWCERNGFKHAKTSIPPEWLDEPFSNRWLGAVGRILLENEAEKKKCSCKRKAGKKA